MIISCFAISDSFAQIQSSIVVFTDKISYSKGETILVSGEVRDLYSGTPVSIIIRAPNGDLVSISQVSVGADKKFHTSLTAGGALMSSNGSYDVHVQYGAENRSGSTSFMYGSYHSSEITDLEISSPKITSNAYGSANLDQSIYSIGRTDSVMVKVFGNISNPSKGSKVAVTLTTPEFDSTGQHVFPTDKGDYEVIFPFDYYSTEGTYKVMISYSSNVIGQMTFDITHKPITIESQNNSPLKITQSVNQNHISIPVGTGAPGCEDSFSCFLPFSAVVNVGEEITWSNDDTAAHTVTSGSPSDGPSGAFDSGLFMAGETYSTTIDESGEYPYFCMVHPWMIGTITVN